MFPVSNFEPSFIFFWSKVKLHTVPSNAKVHIVPQSYGSHLHKSHSWLIFDLKTPRQVIYFWLVFTFQKPRSSQIPTELQSVAFAPRFPCLDLWPRGRTAGTQNRGRGGDKTRWEKQHAERLSSCPRKCLSPGPGWNRHIRSVPNRFGSTVNKAGPLQRPVMTSNSWGPVVMPSWWHHFPL